MMGATVKKSVEFQKKSAPKQTIFNMKYPDG
ncbi:hypothetical protein BH11BAC3_BH11BAC3_00110 [soil metagenome]